MQRDQIERLKNAIYEAGVWAVSDFVGYDCSYRNKEEALYLLNGAAYSKSDYELAEYYNKYVLRL